MTVSTAVSALAKAIESQITNPTDAQARSLAVLRQMPAFSDQRRLDDWEREYKASLSDCEEHLNNSKAIDLVFELGALNLYTTFRGDLTANCYRQLVGQLSSLGYSVPEDIDVSTW